MKFSPSGEGGCFPEVFFPISPMVGHADAADGRLLWQRRTERGAGLGRPEEEGILSSRPGQKGMNLL